MVMKSRKTLSFSPRDILPEISLFFTLLLPFFSIAQQQEDRNVVIESKKQEFSFSRNKGTNPVEIREEYVERYRCNEVRTDIHFSEMYNENESIEDVEVKLDGKKIKGFTPNYDYYSVENIFYSDARVCYFSIPLSSKGSYSEISLVKTYRDPRYFTTVYFNEGYFVENKTVSFIIPRWMKAEIREYNFDGYTIQKSVVYDAKADADVITYTAVNLPAYKREAFAPGGSYIHPHLLILCKEADVNGRRTVFFNTLDDQYKWYHQLVQHIGDDKAVLQKKALELTAGLTDDLQRVKTIFNWVQQNIRYIAFEDGIAGFKPAKADDVMNKKYGDCKGMANLTRGLLQSLGFDARLCWIGTNHIAYDYSTPSMAVDNHMICALFYKGKKYFLDATETNIGFNEYAERIQGRQVLIEDGDSYLLERVPLISPEQNLQEEKAGFVFDGAEDLKGSVHIDYYGEARSDLLNKMEGTKKDNLLKSLMSYLAEEHRNYEISNLNTGSLTGPDTVLRIQYDVLHKKAASAFGNEVYLEADFRKDFDGFIIDTVKRRFDVMLPYKMDQVFESSIKIPAGYKVNQLPSSKEWDHPNIHISLLYTRKGDVIDYKKQIRITDTRLRKAAFSDWNRVIRELGKEYREQIIFEKQ